MCSLFDPVLVRTIRSDQGARACDRYRRAFAAARRGDGAAAYEIANAYYGHWLEPAPPEAYYRWCAEAARLGHEAALVDVARLQLFGDGVRQDRRAAWKTLTAALQARDKAARRHARVLVGACLLHGWGCTRRARAGLRQLRLEAGGGSLAAAEILGEALFEGAVVRRNYAEAARWLTRAARADFPASARRLAELFERGYGVERSPKRAFHWMERAARRGDREAMHLLALYHQDGIGTPQHRTLARRWFRRAWEVFRNASSAFHLALLDRDAGAHGAARRWLLRAAEDGHAIARAFVKHEDAKLLAPYMP